MGEIGSEFFWDKDNFNDSKFNNLWDDGHMVFSGRTAIETVLNNEPSIHRALLPSYCCDSMIEPFRRAGIEVKFYPVNYENGLKIDLNDLSDADCILWCNYFGFINQMPELDDFINSGGIIIEDITHSFFSSHQFHGQSQYLVASLRKWEPVLCGGYCASNKNKMTHMPTRHPSELYLENKQNAMILKRRYLEGEKNIDKNLFLRMFSESQKWLADNYSEITIDEYSRSYLLHADLQAHREKRIKNAQVLYDGLKNHSDIDFLFPLDLMDCPLFVPVVIQNGKRNEISKKLIEHEIYCPLHWPHPNADCESNLYNIELSLVCDQRYKEDDMRRIVEVLN